MFSLCLLKRVKLMQAKASRNGFKDPAAATHGMCPIVRHAKYDRHEALSILNPLITMVSIQDGIEWDACLIVRGSGRIEKNYEYAPTGSSRSTISLHSQACFRVTIC